MVENQDKVRLFVAIDIPEEIFPIIKQAEKELKASKTFEGTYVNKDQYHITLKFIGDVSQNVVPFIKKGLEQIKIKRFYADVGELDVLPSPDRVSVIFMHVDCPELDMLAHFIESALEDVIEPSDRPFLSHMTLARVKTVKDRDALLHAIEDIEMPNLDFEVTSIKLKQSTSTPEGHIYTDVAEFKLK